MARQRQFARSKKKTVLLIRQSVPVPDFTQPLVLTIANGFYKFAWIPSCRVGAMTVALWMAPEFQKSKLGDVILPWLMEKKKCLIGRLVRIKHQADGFQYDRKVLPD